MYWTCFAYRPLYAPLLKIFNATIFIAVLVKARYFSYFDKKSRCIKHSHCISLKLIRTLILGLISFRITCFSSNSIFSKCPINYTFVHQTKEVSNPLTNIYTFVSPTPSWILDKECLYTFKTDKPLTVSAKAPS